VRSRRRRQPSQDLAPGALNGILKQAQLGGRHDVDRFLVVIERAEGSSSAYAPDLPGCVATGETREEVERNVREATRLHVEGLREDHLAVPRPESFADISL
jgi:predicted RNase H-like HicB family nuclease